MLTGTINEKDRGASEGIIKISSRTCEAFKSPIHTVNARKTENRGGKASHKVKTSDRSESTGLAVLTGILSRIHPAKVESLWCCSAACVRLIIYYLKLISTVYY